VVVLPAATKGIPIVLPHAGAITIEASWICNRITVYVCMYLKSFTDQSDMSPRKTPTQELMWKRFILTLYLVSVWVFPM
jgi:hypothetical protein